MNSQLSFIFEEDKQFLGTPADLAKCVGARVALDTETTGLRWWNDKVLGVSVHCPERSVSCYIPTMDPSVWSDVQSVLKVLTSDPQTKARFHNAKFDLHFLGIRSWECRWSLLDTTILAHLYDSRLKKSLGALEEKFLKTNTKKGFLGTLDKKGMTAVPVGIAAEYAVNDVRLTYELADILLPEIQRLGLMNLLKMQMEYVTLLQRVEHQGMLLDQDFIDRAKLKFETNLAAMEKELFTKATNGQPFNWRSHPVLGRVCYEGMGIPRPKNPFADADGVDRTRFAFRGKYNATMTSTFVMMEKAHHPLGAHIQDMRETDKLLDALLEWERLADDERVIHTSFNPTGTRTGRLSSSKPNLQNVASDVRVRYTQSVYSGGTSREEEYNLRLGLKAREGHVLVSVDFAQQEMRLFALSAKEQTLVDAIKRREDIHSMIAKEVWGDDIAKDPSCLPIRREWSKTISFGLLYGMTTGSLEHRLNKTREESHRIAEDYWRRFPRIKPYMAELVESCRREGFVRYWSNRIWREENEKDMYKAVNATVQGGSADLLATAALRVQKYLDEQQAGQIVNFVHDELISEIKSDRVAEIAPSIAKIQEVEDLLGAPFLVDCKVGTKWGNMMKLAKWTQEHSQ